MQITSGCATNANIVIVYIDKGFTESNHIWVTPGQTIVCDGVYDQTNRLWVDDGLRNYHGIVGQTGVVLMHETWSPLMIVINGWAVGMGFAVLLAVIMVVKKALKSGAAFDT